MSDDFAARIAMQERMDRAAKMARTYLRKASLYLHPRPAHVLVSYWDLLDTSLDVALDIVEALPDDFFEATDVEDFFGLGGGGKHNSSDEPLERAAKVVAAIERRRGGAKRRRKIEALENTVGRTEEEAASYRAAAERLRASR